MDINGIQSTIQPRRDYIEKSLYQNQENLFNSNSNLTSESIRQEIPNQEGIISKFRNHQNPQLRSIVPLSSSTSSSLPPLSPPPPPPIKTTEEFDMDLKTPGIKLYNNNRTAVHMKQNSSENICAKNIYRKGCHFIQMKIDDLNLSDKNKMSIDPNAKGIRISIIDVGFIQSFLNKSWEGSLNYLSDWFGRAGGWIKQSRSTNQFLEKYTPSLKTNDIFTIKLDMDKGKVSFIINEINYGVAFQNIPHCVCIGIEMCRYGDQISFL